MGVAERAAALRNRPGLLGRWCGVLYRVRTDLHHTEQHAATAMHRLAARLVRLFFELLVLVVIAVAELDVVLRKAAHALATPPKR
jgi:hypothetical protein